MDVIVKGRYRARLAETATDVASAQALRHRCFRGGEGRDVDRFDTICKHLLIEDLQSGDLQCCFRFLPLAGGDQIDQCYAAQFYELSALRRFAGPMIEMGRFCIHPAVQDPDILRLAWGAITRFVDQQGVQMLFGCSSFHGLEAEAHAEAFAMLKDGHLAPRRWRPRVKMPEVFRFARVLRTRKPDRARALLTMPPLLRSYLAMGGWVSDHAVVDRDLNTLHVFTGLEIGAIPPARARALRMVAG